MLIVCLPMFAHHAFGKLSCRYHSHFGTQYMDGVKGVFVVNDQTETKDYVDSVMQVTDW